MTGAKMKLPTPTQTFLPLIFGCLALACAPGSTQAQGPDAGTLVFSNVTSVAREITKITKYTGGGTPRVLVTKSNLFRDSKGRVRVERFYDGTDHPPEDTPSDISRDTNPHQEADRP